MKNEKIIYSAIQPTGNIHLGNYLGAIKNWVDLQNSGKYKCIFAIADYHSLTGNIDAEFRRSQIIRTAAELLAAGIDPEKSIFYIQSQVPEHTELTWIFNCVCPISELERMTQYKDKSSHQAKNINAGLLTYPVLQAADILLYKANTVPVGKDQIQHVEITRDIAKWFNKRYENYFSTAEVLLTETPKIMSLVDSTKKMSKSLGENHVIELADDEETIKNKIKKAVSDKEGILNLLNLLKNFGEEIVYKQFLEEYKKGILKNSDLKVELTNAIAKYFADFRQKRKELLENHDKIAEILIAGSKKASVIAKETINDVRKIIGVR
ncbi:MAG: tryptophan--tRNA ligase [Patescibacteria group bacterium]